MLKWVLVVVRCVISQRYSKLKAIHNHFLNGKNWMIVVLYLKDTQNWKQFTTVGYKEQGRLSLCYISKILKIESNSQRVTLIKRIFIGCVISQRYSKLKAIHNLWNLRIVYPHVVLYLKDTQNWKQFTTEFLKITNYWPLCYISKILKIESNSQPVSLGIGGIPCCVISQRYSKLKAIHNESNRAPSNLQVVLYLKDTQNWKQFTTTEETENTPIPLCYISKILKIESNSQLTSVSDMQKYRCVISQRYSKLKAIQPLSLNFKNFPILLVLKTDSKYLI